jgi:medium-chain acyl-[acyl-carrier-protein] hydrolase
VFNAWGEALGDVASVNAVEYPGHGGRRDEPFVETLDDLADEVVGALNGASADPLVLFGHSMGARVALEVARRLTRIGQPPALMIVSGCSAPHLPEEREPAHALPTDAFIKRLRELNGTPEEVLANDELLELVVPVLRADFRLCETHKHEVAPRLRCPVLALGGLQDAFCDRASVLAWQEYTAGHFQWSMFPGGHFFIHSSERLLLDVVARHVLKVTER